MSESLFCDYRCHPPTGGAWDPFLYIKYSLMLGGQCPKKGKMASRHHVEHLDPNRAVLVPERRRLWSQDDAGGSEAIRERSPDRGWVRICCQFGGRQAVRQAARRRGLCSPRWRGNRGPAAPALAAQAGGRGGWDHQVERAAHARAADQDARRRVHRNHRGRGADRGAWNHELGPQPVGVFVPAQAVRQERQCLLRHACRRPGAAAAGESTRPASRSGFPGSPSP